LREQLAILIRLQKTESAVAGISAKKKDLPVRMGTLEQEFKTFCAVVEKEREQLEALRKSRRDKDTHLQKGQEILKRSRERLFEVKTNKEYQSILKEIENLEEKNSRMEDEIISLLEELDHFEKSVQDKEEELQVRRLRYDEEKKNMEAELQALEEELDVCVRKIADLKKDIPADVLRKYEQIKSIGRGVAVASVWKEVCDGCHMSIPPQLYNQLQKSTALITCPNCNRIIYWEHRED
jgi:predicted  nucleic acid-binding Zn-ribbon protein